MKYSTRNLNEDGLTLPLPFPVKVIVEYKPGGVSRDLVVVYSANPERAADETVLSRGWDKEEGYDPRNVWVDGAV